MMRQHDLDVTLRIRGPVRSQIRHPDQHYLPYSLVGGRLRQSLEELERPELEDLFGERSGPDLAPARGRLLFTDFVCQDVPDQEAAAIRVAIDPERGAARRQALLVKDSPFASGKEISFRGTISFLSDDVDHAARIERSIVLGLRYITSLGGDRSIGCGRLMDVQVARSERTWNIVAPAAGPAPAVSLILRDFTLPLCVTRRPGPYNLYESSRVLPGAVLKGALASLLGRLTGCAPEELDRHQSTVFAALRQHLGALRFTHAFPSAAAKGTRPKVPPLSTVVVKEGGKPRWYDVARVLEPRPIHGQAPAFAPDWKPDDERLVWGDFGWPEIRHERRVRTKIDRETQRAADEQLFTYEMLATENLVFHGQIDFCGVPEPERGMVLAELKAVLMHGLPNLGKTKSCARQVTLTPIDGTSSRCKQKKGTWVLCLQTPALLADPEELLLRHDDATLRDEYTRIFAELSGGLLTLENHYARQDLYGGYLALRYARRGQPYYPYFVTEPGSVFVLRAPAEQSKLKEAEGIVTRWRDHGLPLPRWAEQRYLEADIARWRTCPFIPENGFGEVEVNMDCHIQRKPPSEVPDAR